MVLMVRCPRCRVTPGAVALPGADTGVSHTALSPGKAHQSVRTLTQEVKVSKTRSASLLPGGEAVGPLSSRV